MSTTITTFISYKHNSNTNEFFIDLINNSSYTTSKLTVGLPSANPNAFLTVAGGTSIIAPIILNTGINLTTPINGAFEFDGVDYFQTVNGVRNYTFGSRLIQTSNQTRFTHTLAPPIGEASFRFRGFGVTASDRHFALRNSADTGDLFTIGGSGNMGLLGDINFGSASYINWLSGVKIRSSATTSWSVLDPAFGTRFQVNWGGVGSFLNTNLSIGSASGDNTTFLKIAAGNTLISPIKLTAGVNLNTPENGAFEFDGTNLYFTVGGVRKTVTLT